MTDYDDEEYMPTTQDKNPSKTDKIPSKTEAINTLIRLNLQRHILNHVLAVSRTAVKIAAKIPSADLRLVRIGAILHDIGRIKTHNYDHAYMGGDIIRELGFSEKLARIAECHMLGGITKEEAVELGLPARDFMPETIEEKIVCLSDKYHVGTRQVTIESRFRNWTTRFGETDFLKKSKKRVEDLETGIYKLMYP